jgi:hypothetical protein
MSDNQQIINVDFFCLHCEKFDLTNMIDNQQIINVDITKTWWEEGNQVMVKPS